MCVQIFRAVRSRDSYKEMENPADGSSFIIPHCFFVSLWGPRSFPRFHDDVFVCDFVVIRIIKNSRNLSTLRPVL